MRNVMLAGIEVAVAGKKEKNESISTGSIRAIFFAVIVASGTAFLTTWPVWLAGGLASWALDALFGGWALAIPGRFPGQRVVVQPQS